jgi:hypothetical protein
MHVFVMDKQTYIRAVNLKHKLVNSYRQNFVQTKKLPWKTLESKFEWMLHKCDEKLAQFKGGNHDTFLHIIIDIFFFHFFFPEKNQCF